MRLIGLKHRVTNCSKIPNYCPYEGLTVEEEDEHAAD